MYLLHREGDELEQIELFSPIPWPYAILSHTWGPDEVSFKDIRKGRGRSKAGFKKIEFCMDQAFADDLHYCWVDTCCIDKANNNEVSEAINSMFRWYQDAAKCYVYLSDVPEQSFQTSRWFTRGWTLQELLAPKVVEFFASTGERLGDKISLLHDIHQRTQIPVAALQGQAMCEFSNVEKMSWIAKRETKREEDIAYSLLGIFGVAMPLIYGEQREKAFSRLWKHIEEGSTHTDFANHTDVDQVRNRRQMGLLPERDQRRPEPSLDALTRVQASTLQSGHYRKSNIAHRQPGVECETGIERLRIQTAITQHMDSTSQRVPDFKCVTCEKRFDSKIAANQHMEATGHRDAKFKCVTCEKRFDSEIAANQHMDATSHGKPKFRCVTCGKRFRSEIAANQHMEATGH